MKNLYMKFFTLIIILLPFLGFSQIAAWDFTGESNLATSTAEIYNANLDASSTLTRGVGAIASAGANSFRTQGFQNDGIATTNIDYFENTFSAAVGYKLSLSTIDAAFAGTGTYSVAPGVTMQYAYSLDGTTFTLIGAPFIRIGNGVMTQIDLSGITQLQNVLDNVTVTIRLYASGQTATGGWGYNSTALGVNGLAFGGTVSLVAVGCNTSASIFPTACTSYTVPSGDETYTMSGIFMDTIPNVAMCDSILTIDLTITSGIVYYQDLDGDTYGSNVTTTACSQPVGYVTNNLDCDDTNPSINPGAFDIPGNGIDEDCSGADATLIGTDMGMYEFTQLSACPVTANTVTAQPTEAVFSIYSSAGTNCSAAANVFNNSGWNLTPTLDITEYNAFSITANNCYSMDLNRIIFTHRISGSGGTPTWVLRSSLDNYTTNIATGTPITTDKTDTINLSAAFDAVSQVTFRFYIINIAASGATWRNDNVRLIGNFTVLTPQTYYADTDGDTYGNPLSTISTCTQPVGYVLDNTDCNDANAAINPATVWFEDQDLDTYGNSAVTFTGCTPPPNYVLIGGDCDDTDNSITVAIMYFVDADSDGYGNLSTGMSYCVDPGVGYTTDSADCNDANPAVNPGSPEICDGLDNNCNSSIDEGLTFVNYYTDADNDNFGTGTAQSMCSDPGAGYATVAGDCNDTDNTVYPGATEILDNGIDENCDGTDNYLGLEEVSVMNFTISPNPSNGSIALNFNQSEQGMVYCTDLQGKVLITQNLNDAKMQMDLSALSSGTYMLRVVTENGISLKRIVIQK